MRRASNMTEARKLRKQLARELDDHGADGLNGDQITFAKLANEYKSKRIFPAKIVSGRKVAGLKSVRPVEAALKPLTEHFGKRRIRAITHATIEAYKVHRLETATIHKGQRQIASVNS